MLFTKYFYSVSQQYVVYQKDILREKRKKDLRARSRLFDYVPSFFFVVKTMFNRIKRSQFEVTNCILV